MARLLDYYNTTVVDELTQQVWVQVENGSAENHQGYPEHGGG
jgi:hypothetical protein